MSSIHGSEDRGIHPNVTAKICESSARFGEDIFPIDAFRIGPQAFEIVQLARIGQEDVDDDIAPVLQDPRTLFVPFGRRRFISAGLHQDANFVSQRVHLANIGAGCNDEKVHNRRDRRQIKYDDVLTAILFAEFGNVTRIFQAALQSGCCGGGCGGRNSETPGIGDGF